jgi:hypothetical protein
MAIETVVADTVDPNWAHEVVPGTVPVNQLLAVIQVVPAAEFHPTWAFKSPGTNCEAMNNPKKPNWLFRDFIWIFLHIVFVLNY